MLSSDLLQGIVADSDQEAWITIIEHAYEVFSIPFVDSAIQEILHREKYVSDIETLLSGSCWDLWSSFEQVVPKSSELLIERWNQILNGKAVFIIDGMSLRELPFLLAQAEKRGYQVHQSRVSASSLPSETTFFARSLGFSQRSALENNQAGTRHLLQGAKTDCVNMHWEDCISIIDAEPNWVLWHTWFDDRIHEYNTPGKGIRELIAKSEKEFTSDSFWSLIDKLAQGRRVFITSDHGYASTGHFDNVFGEQASYLKETYKSQRFAKGGLKRENWIPPIDAEIKSMHGLHSYVLGRRKWRSSGGYPTLAHGGLSLMETLVPFIEISK
ncbi:hypothetical protein [Bacillus cereus group sp. BfR-BA-01310]|uniref:hypothetical protein n=1 Tax=Bacillus cereus group sp. BfR-BA-01310 TaxID=2920287 RepID=UPI001F57F0DE|nr:hypothetical protein [Bacillus cereus group sp. BfR-BA-01310]